MTNSNNVITFPGSKKNTPNASHLEFNEEESLSNILEVKIMHINEALFVIIPQLFNSLEMLSPTPDELDSSKDVNMIVESIKSLLFKNYGIEHPFQKLAESTFTMNDENIININNVINVDLTEFIKEE
jgi:hypothetical protein